MKFRNLHYQEKPLILYNIWDAASAKVVEKLGHQALATASSAFADMFGLKDGKDLTFEEQKFMIKRIAKASNLPLTVDLEAGYSDDPVVIAQNLKEIAELGVSGVNLEDSNIQAEAKLIDAEEQANKFKVIKETLASAGVDLFINARIDTYIMGFFGKPTSNALEESLKRIKLYEEAGVDGVFIPFLSDRNEISEIVKATKLPVNISVDPDDMDINALAALGVKRVSMGNILLSKMMMNFETYLTNLPK